MGDLATDYAGTIVGADGVEQNLAFHQFKEEYQSFLDNYNEFAKGKSKCKDADVGSIHVLCYRRNDLHAYARVPVQEVRGDTQFGI